MSLVRSSGHDLGRFRSLAVRRAAFYGVCTALLVLIITDRLRIVMPDRLATRIGRNRESLLFAILMALTIEFVRPWIARRRRDVIEVGAYGLALLVGAWALKESGLSTDVTTLHESITAVGLLAWYVQPSRPRRWLPAVAVLVAAGAALLYEPAGPLGTGLPLVLDQAEAIGFLVLTPLALDVFDRTILDPAAPDRPRLRLAWVVGLVVMWAGVLLAARRVRRGGVDGALEQLIDVAQRAAEGGWGVLLLSAYFSYWLVTPWRRASRPGFGA